MWPVGVFLMVTVVTVTTGFPFECEDLGCGVCSAPRVVAECVNHCKKNCRIGGGSEPNKPGKTDKLPKSPNTTKAKGTAPTKQPPAKTTQKPSVATMPRSFEKTAVPLNQANARFKACCDKQFSAPQEMACISLCKYDITHDEFQKAIRATTCPTKYLSRTLRCANAGSDNTACCQAKHVLDRRPQCAEFCTKEANLGVLGQQHLACSHFINTIMKCHQSSLKPGGQNNSATSTNNSKQADKGESSKIPKPSGSKKEGVSSGRPAVDKKSEHTSGEKKIQEKPSENQKPKTTAAPNYDVPVVSVSEANNQFGQCCQEKFSFAVDKGCIPLCKYDVELSMLHNALVTWKCNVFKLPDYLKCASGGNDNSACCNVKKVTEGKPQCAEFCTKNVGAMGLQHIACAASFGDVLKCHHSGLKPAET